MRLVFSTSDFIYDGTSRQKFPLVLDNQMRLADPFHDFLVYHLLDRGCWLDVKTWEAYGRAIWDFSRYLDANGFTWNRHFSSPGKSVLRKYRDWLINEKLKPGTINFRIRTAVSSKLASRSGERRAVNRYQSLESHFRVRYAA